MLTAKDKQSCCHKSAKKCPPNPKDIKVKGKNFNSCLCFKASTELETNQGSSSFSTLSQGASKLPANNLIGHLMKNC